MSSVTNALTAGSKLLRCPAEVKTAERILGPAAMASNLNVAPTLNAAESKHVACEETN